MSPLQITEIAKAQPQITQAVETMVQKGKWSVPGYRVRSKSPKRSSTFADHPCGRPQEKFGEFSLM